MEMFNDFERQMMHKSGVNLLSSTRTIYLNGEVNDSMAYWFNVTLLMLEGKDEKADITVYINSPGGSVSDGLAMIDTMNLISCDVSTVCVGMAASMGAMILLSGTKGKRKILPHSKVLIHQPLGGMGQGVHQATDIKITADSILKTRDTLYSMISDATGQPFEKIALDCERDYTLDAQEALAYGLVDDIVESHKR